MENRFCNTISKAVSNVIVCCVPFLTYAAPAAILQGRVQLGPTSTGHLFANVRVSLYEATPSEPNLLGQAITDADGAFTITTPFNTSPSVFYLEAPVSGTVELVTILGSALPAQATVNELTTVAAAYSMAQFYRTGSISGDAFGLRIAAGMNENLVSTTTGTPSAVLLTSPNADQTISLRETRSLANLLSACAESEAVTESLLTLTATGESRPANTATALANLARNPQRNVEAVYKLTTKQNRYYPSLTRAPDAWTLAVKVNDSGDDANLFGGPARLVFDKNGYAWVTNNVVQGTRNSSRTLMVLQPNGKPSNGVNGTPISPLTSGGILGGAYGITIDPHRSVWEGNFGWGLPTPENVPSSFGNGSVSQFSPSGIPLSPSDAYQGGPVRAQGMASDSEGNIWICSYGTDEIYVFLRGDPHQAIKFKEERKSAPFDIAISKDGTAWVSNSGGFTGRGPSGIAKYRMAGRQLTQEFLVPLPGSLKGLALDSEGNAWVASLQQNAIFGISPTGAIIGTYHKAGMDGPWGVTVDGDDNLWVSNFGQLGLSSNFTQGRLSKLCGVSKKDCGPGAKLGDAISPASGLTMPTAGSPVLLHNGQPLYGSGFPASFAPMQRQTSSSIDQAGNVWSLNNWKPSFLIDEFLNPGGDGIVIFVGLATPPKQTF